VPKLFLLQLRELSNFHIILTMLIQVFTYMDLTKRRVTCTVYCTV
jgi:hypothetical protein